MYLADIDFTEKKFVINFIEQYKKNISKTLEPYADKIFKVGNHICMVRTLNNYSNMMIADVEIKLLEDSSVDDETINRIYDLSATITVYDNYLIVNNNSNIYVNGNIVNNIKISNNSYYHDYLIIHSYHIATFEHIDNIIKPLRDKLCKIRKKFYAFYSPEHLYRGVPIIASNCIRLDRFLLYIYATCFNKTLYVSLKLSV